MGNALNIQAEFTAPLGISRIRLLLNGAALDSVVFDDASEAPTTRYVYALEKRIDDIAPQNQLRLEVTDIFNNTAFADAIEPGFVGTVYATRPVHAGAGNGWRLQEPIGNPNHGN